MYVVHSSVSGTGHPWHSRHIFGELSFPPTNERLLTTVMWSEIYHNVGISTAYAYLYQCEEVTLKGHDGDDKFGIRLVNAMRQVGGSQRR